MIILQRDTQPSDILSGKVLKGFHAGCSSNVSKWLSSEEPGIHIGTLEQAQYRGEIMGSREIYEVIVRPQNTRKTPVADRVLTFGSKKYQRYDALRKKFFLKWKLQGIDCLWYRNLEEDEGPWPNLSLIVLDSKIIEKLG